MKTIYNIALMILIIILSEVIQTNPAKSKENFSLIGGIGFPELLNIGAKYRINQIQVGLAVGSFPVKNNPFLSLSTDVIYHFAGNSTYTTQKPWFGKVGFDYIRDENINEINEYTYLNTQIGREFNFSQKMGISASLGAVFQLSRKTNVKISNNNGWNFDFNFPFLPAVSVLFFYRI